MRTLLGGTCQNVRAFGACHPLRAFGTRSCPNARAILIGTCQDARIFGQGVRYTQAFPVCKFADCTRYAAHCALVKTTRARLHLGNGTAAQEFSAQTPNSAHLGCPSSTGGFEGFLSILCVFENFRTPSICSRFTPESKPPVERIQGNKHKIV